jgi:HSP20 family protein
MEYLTLITGFLSYKRQRPESGVLGTQESERDMLLTPFDPFAEFHRVLRTADGGHAAMRMDAIRRDGEVELRFDLPGIETDSIDVTVDHGWLTVSAKRSEEYADSERPYVRERVMGSFTRRVRLSDAVDAEKISAAYDSGVLRVTVPLQERAQPRKIEVSTTAPAAVEA